MSSILSKCLYHNDCKSDIWLCLGVCLISDSWQPEQVWVGGAQSAGYGKQPSSSGSCDRSGGSNTHPDILMTGTSSQESFWLRSFWYTSIHPSFSVHLSPLLSFSLSPSGKSYTMIGRDDSLQGLGIIPCAISWLFKLINERKEKTGARFSVRVSAVEVSVTDETSIWNIPCRAEKLPLPMWTFEKEATK